MGPNGLAAAPRGRRRAPDSNPRPAAVAPAPAERLPPPSALPVFDGGLQDDLPDARVGARRSRSPSALLARPGDEGPRGGEAARGNDGGGRLGGGSPGLERAAADRRRAPHRRRRQEALPDHTRGDLPEGGR